MKTEIETNIIHEFCLDFLDYLESSIVDDPDSFPYTILCSHFIDELQKHGMSADFNSFDSAILAKVYQEIGEYIRK